MDIIFNCVSIIQELKFLRLHFCILFSESFLESVEYTAININSTKDKSSQEVVGMAGVRGRG